MKIRISSLVALFLMMFLVGCGVFRFVAGTSISRLKKEENGRYILELPLSRVATFALVTGVVSDLKLIDYLCDQEEGYLITMGYDRIFSACIDTTEVGYFVSEITPHQATRLEVVSLNNPLAQFVAGNFTFFALSPKREQYPAFEVNASFPVVWEIVGQMVSNKRGRVIGEGHDYLVISGLKIGKEQEELDSPLVLFFQEISSDQVMITVGTYSSNDADRILPYLEKVVERALAAQQ